MVKPANKYSLSQDYMPEAEVALRLAFYLLDLPGLGHMKCANVGRNSSTPHSTCA